MAVMTGLVLYVDRPADHLQHVQHAAANLRLAQAQKWEGPLRSRGATPQDKRVLFKVYFLPGVTDLALEVAANSSRAYPDLEEFAVGSQQLFADPTAMKVDFTSLDALRPVQNLIAQSVVISPKLALMIPRVTCQETWTTSLTAMRNRCPEVAITRISWRKEHHEVAIWAHPQVLPAQARADRVEEGRRRRPGGMHVYLAELLTVTINGSLGPQPDVLLTEFLAQIRTALGRVLARGRQDSALHPDQYLEESWGWCLERSDRPSTHMFHWDGTPVSAPAWRRRGHWRLVFHGHGIQSPGGCHWIAPEKDGGPGGGAAGEPLTLSPALRSGPCAETALQ